MKVRFGRRALVQVGEIRDRIAIDDVAAARAVVARIESLAALLGRYPSIGRATDLASIRVLSLRPYPYLLFYAVDAGRDEVVVLRIRHTARKSEWRSGR